MKDIQSIIESNTINDEEKDNKIREIYKELKKKELDELRKIFNIDAFKIILNYINNCRTGIEKILLDIIELIAENGVYEYDQWDPPDPIFNDIKSSGLNDKIKQMIKDKIEEEKEQKKYSDETEQLIRIYVQIMKGNESNQQMINICAQVIDKNINNLLITINKLKDEDNKGIKKEQENEETEREIKQSSQLIKVITLIKEKVPNIDWMTRIPDQNMKIVKERICPLIHLNCPPDINCQYCINVPQSLVLLELKSYVFQTLADVSYDNDEFRDMLVNDHNIIPHLTHPLIQFASQSQLDKRIDQQEQHNQQKSESTSSLSLIASSINLLKRLISKNNICKVVINTPNALHSLFTLSIYKLNIHFNKIYDIQTFEVRHSSRWCLWFIQVFGDLSAHSEFINARYVGVLVIAISTASGSGEEYDGEISLGLDNISDFIRDLHQGKNNYATFPPQPLLARRSDEQLEEEGAIEEIDSLQKYKGDYDHIKISAIRAKGMILNYFIEQDNPRPDQY
ncbi:MAG: hypothetical protein EZS28_017885 [Streblomastix strix]|uniref:Uncharacterized protein n=1 Tax=Streblomastix strix TaxID=222440 RepID=A0A5J4VVM8_9EUKA|nr:MAG: hypothetical protein EZS28_017885 [Streblomastix strix]